MLTCFCVEKCIGTVFHRTKADMCTAPSHAYHTNHLNNQVHELVIRQKSESRDQFMKLAFDVDHFFATVQSIAPEL